MEFYKNDSEISDSKSRLSTNSSLLHSKFLQIITKVFVYCFVFLFYESLYAKNFKYNHRKKRIITEVS